MFKQIPILFNTDMVRAIQREVNPKTQTRRTKGLEIVNVNPDDWTLEHNLISQEFFFFHKNEEDLMHNIKSQFGKVGDLLYVREKFMFDDGEGVYHYAANMDDSDVNWLKGSWHPSIHMPKSATRICLEITDIKIERLQSIDNKGAKAEGVSDTIKLHKLEKLSGLGDWKIPAPFSGYQFSFLELWCSINGCESWINNPWVWVITFKRIS